MKHSMQALAGAWLAALAAGATAAPAAVASLPVPTLKALYLSCDQMSATRVLDSATASHCSVIAEELLQRGFEGDFDALHAWWQRERRKPDAAAGASLPAEGG